MKKGKVIQPKEQYTKEDKQKEVLLVEANYEYDSHYPLLSVVIPIYNVEKYIARCLESIINQSYKNIEIICIDDASPAKEGVIIKEYCKKDSRIKYVRHKKNEGLFQTRITGMKYATGDYFAFLDSDDHLSVDFYRTLMKKITEENADIVVGDFVDEYEDGRLEYYNYDNIRFQDIDLQGDAVYDAFMKQHGLWFGWHTVWNKIYKRELWISSVPFFEEFSNSHGHLIMTEDIAYSCIFWHFANRVVNAHNSFYFYYHHLGQSVANGNLKKFEKNVRDVAAVFEFFRNFLVHQNLWERYESDYKEFLDVYIEFWTGNAMALEDEKRSAEQLIKGLFGSTKETNYKDHYHYSMKTSVATFEWFEDIKKTICSPDIEIVSFDFFDTLVLRPFFVPSDLFGLMNQKFNEIVKSVAFIDFQKVRINVEAELRQCLSMAIEEVTLQKIYDRIASIYELSDEQKNVLMECEVELELKYIRPRMCGQELYELAKYLKKRVIIVSDIYLPNDIIRKMLVKCGYEPDQIYLSSDYLVTKRTGNLYSVVLKSERTTLRNIVHIGDNWDVDVVKAQSRNITAHHLAAPCAQFKGENGGIYSGGSFYKIFKPNGKLYMSENAAEFLGIRCMLAMVANKFFDNPYTVPFNPDTDFNGNAYFIGYYLLGMHLYAVTDWLRSIAYTEKRRKIHFVSRDGFLPMKAMEILNSFREEKVDYSYFYISRKASALLQTVSITDLESYFNSFGSYDISIKTPIDTFSILAKDELKNNISILAKHGIVYYGKTKGFSESMNLGKTIFTEYIDGAKANDFLEKAKTYFSAQIADNDIIFDLGYRANKEYILSSVMGKPVDCLYIYANESKAIERAITNGFSLRTFYDYTPSAFAAARELMFSELRPSCIGYDANNNMHPLFDSSYSEHYFNRYVIESMQKGALDFIYDFESVFAGTIVTKMYRKFDASLPFEYFLNYSSQNDRSIFGCVTFEDDTFAGEPSKLLDDWNVAISYHKLDAAFAQNYNVKTQIRVVEKEYEPFLIQPEKDALINAENQIYADGIFIKAFEWINRKFPIGSKKRERIKKILRFLFH